MTPFAFIAAKIASWVDVHRSTLSAAERAAADVLDQLEADGELEGRAAAAMEYLAAETVAIFDASLRRSLGLPTAGGWIKSVDRLDWTSAA